jgi:hypothetical protein
MANDLCHIVALAWSTGFLARVLEILIFIQRNNIESAMITHIVSPKLDNMFKSMNVSKDDLTSTLSYIADLMDPRPRDSIRGLIS